MKPMHLCSVILLTVSGCFYGDDLRVETTPISNRAYPPPNTEMVELFFRDHVLVIDRPYEQMCRIEVKGTEGTTASELTETLKREAAARGADAVIDVVQAPIARESGELLTEALSGFKIKPKAYVSVSLSGIAIKFR